MLAAPLPAVGLGTLPGLACAVEQPEEEEAGAELSPESAAVELDGNAAPRVGAARSSGTK